jgi:hypothetical protein
MDVMWGQLFPLFQINQIIARLTIVIQVFGLFLYQTMVGLQLHVIHGNIDALYVI